MSKNFILSSLVVGGLLVTVGAGCASKTKLQSTASVNNSKTEVNTPVAPKDCKNDVACASQLLISCTPGTFSTTDGANTMMLTVGPKDGDYCTVDSAMDISTAPDMIKKYDENKDNKLSLICKIPTNLRSYDDMKNYLQAGDNLSKCTGETVKLQQDLMKQGLKQQ